MAFGLGERPFVDEMPALWMTASIRPIEYLHGDASGVDRATEIADDHASGSRRNIVERGGSLARSGVQRDLMPLVDERPRGGTAQAVCAASDEDASHRTALYPASISPTGSAFSLCLLDIARRRQRRRGTPAECAAGHRSKAPPATRRPSPPDISRAWCRGSRQRRRPAPSTQASARDWSCRSRRPSHHTSRAALSFGRSTIRARPIPGLPLLPKSQAAAAGAYRTD